jgi:hypothetical protein
MTTNTNRKKLIKRQLKIYNHLLVIMRCFKGSNKGNLFSPSLQNKTVNFLLITKQDSGSLDQNIQALKKQITRLEHPNSKKES